MKLDRAHGEDPNTTNKEGTQQGNKLVSGYRKTNKLKTNKQTKKHQNSTAINTVTHAKTDQSRSSL